MRLGRKIVVYNLLKNTIFISIICSAISLLILICRKAFSAKGAWWRSVAWMLVILRLCVPIPIKIPRVKLLDNTPLNNLPEIRESLPIDMTNIYLKSSSKDTIINNTLSSYNFSWTNLIIAVYLLVLAVFIARLIISIIKINSTNRTFKPCCQKQVVKTFNNVKSMLGIKRQIPLLMSLDNTTPALCGWFKPFVVISNELVENITSHHLEQVFIHELTHYKNKDTLKLFLIELAISIHWFNPLLYYLRSVIVQDIELVCDEKVLKRLDRSHYADYGKVLIDCSNKNTITNSLALTTGFISKKQNIKERLKMIKDYNNKRKLIFGTILIIITAISLVACTTIKVEKKIVNLDDDTPKHKGIEYNLSEENKKAFDSIRKLIKDKCDEIGSEYTDTILDNTTLALLQLADKIENGPDIRNILHNNLDFLEDDIMNEPNKRLDVAIAEKLLSVEGPIYNHLNVISFEEAEKIAIKYLLENSQIKDENKVKLKDKEFEIMADMDIAEYIFNYTYQYEGKQEPTLYGIGVDAKTGEIDSFGY
jgi:beta-lactamase regulating signal transducer with metallopeptidase domain